MYRSLLAAVAVALLVAACGGSPQTIRLTPVPGHPCSPSNYYAQCVGPEGPALISPPDRDAPKPSATFRPMPGSSAASSAAFGIDFAYGGPACPTIRAYGATFAASYLSGSSKDWSPGLVDSYRNNGCGIVFVWETSQTRSLAGYNAGYDDAYNATHEAARLGFNHPHIDYASDYDTTDDGSAFVAYYEGAAAWDRKAGATTGAYGGLHTIEVLCADRITTDSWQTLAWSYGYWASPACAPLRQTSINDYWHGYSVDYDEAVAADYGQQNYVPPAVTPVCFGKHASGSKACIAVRRQAAGYQRAVTESNGAFRARGCPTLSRVLSVLAQRAAWFAGKLRTEPRIRRDSRTRALIATRTALASVRKAEGRAACAVFTSRAAYYDGLLTRLEAKYS